MSLFYHLHPVFLFSFMVSRCAISVTRVSYCGGQVLQGKMSLGKKTKTLLTMFWNPKKKLHSKKML